MKKIMIAALLSLSFQATHAQVATADVPGPLATLFGVGEQGIAMGKNLAEAKKVVDQTMQIYNQGKQAYNAVTGTRNLGDLMNNPLLKQYLPENLQKNYDQIMGLYKTGSEMAAFGKQGKSTADTIKRGLDIASQKLQQIDGLRAAINTTEDPKAIAELQARINAEQASIQNEMLKFYMFTELGKANEKMLIQQKNEAYIERQKSMNGIDFSKME